MSARSLQEIPKLVHGSGINLGPFLSPTDTNMPNLSHTSLTRQVSVHRPDIEVSPTGDELYTT